MHVTAFKLRKTSMCYYKYCLCSFHALLCWPCRSQDVTIVTAVTGNRTIHYPGGVPLQIN